MPADRLDAIRGSVLDRMERAERNVRLGLFGAAVLELALFAVAFLMIDWQNRLERLLFVFAVLSYSIIAGGAWRARHAQHHARPRSDGPD